MKRFFVWMIVAVCTTGSGLDAQQLLQRAVRDGRVDSAWSRLETGFSGKGVIIGFTDWGFDYTHPVFYDTSGQQYRVLAAWDQWRRQGSPPQGFSYGTEIRGKEALLAAQCDTSNVYQYNYHGNHVASIAAGSGGGTPYRGVAYDAELLFASFLISEDAVIDAFRWMHRIAQEEQKRLVINMSWGLYYFQNMDGSGRIAQVMQHLSDSGVFFVTSAGNNGDVDFHISRDFSSVKDTLRSRIAFDNSSNAHYWGQAVSMQSDVGGEFRFALQALGEKDTLLSRSDYWSTAKGDAVLDSFMCVSRAEKTDTLFYQLRVEKANEYSGRPQALLKVKTPPAGCSLGLYVMADSGLFHAWNVAELSNGVGNWGDAFEAPLPGWKAGDALYGIGMPAAVPCALSVAAHESVYKLGAATQGGGIARFSSYGPGFNAATKPELSAPGVQVVAAISSYTNRFTGTYTTTVAFNGREYPFAALSGTSMASPFAAGVAALVLQANPYLSCAELKEILTSTAYQDFDTRREGTLRFGAGKINACAAVREALKQTGTQDFHGIASDFSVYPNPAGSECYVRCLRSGGPVRVSLYDGSGRLLKHLVWEEGVHSLSLASLPPGFYYLKLTDSLGSEIRKLVVASR